MPNTRTTYFQKKEKNVTTKKIFWPPRAGFEPTRESSIGFQVQRLNHSAIAAERSQWKKKN